jgi:predicted nucleic acid-binding Zn finger protein
VSAINVKENDNVKIFSSSIYNYYFDKNTGFFARWGKTQEEDPEFSPFGPEIADIELSDICNGIGNYGPCPWCYKANTLNGSYMNFQTYKQIFDKFPSTLTQIAFGVDSKCESNPEAFDIFRYTLDNGIIPNITIADINQDMADELSKYMGSVAVSRYHDKDICYNSIQRLKDARQGQINIHILVSEETLPWIYETFEDYLNDDRLYGLNAIVLLSLKQRGRGVKYKQLSQSKFDNLVYYAMKNDIPIGFDSCSCSKFLNSVEYSPNYESFKQVSEPCESGCFSWYISTYGKGYPCSFTEGIEDWKDGTNMLEIEDFLEDVWFSESVVNFREKLTSNDRECPYFNI